MTIWCLDVFYALWVLDPWPTTTNFASTEDLEIVVANAEISKLPVGAG